MKKIYSALAFALLGLLDTMKLLDDSINGTSVCAPESASLFGISIDCGYVTTSSYSKMFGIPIALFGFLFYLTVLVVLYTYLGKSTVPYLEKKYVILALLTSGAFLYSMYLVYLQLAVMHTICLYCMGSATGSTLIFLLITIPLVLVYRQQNMQTAN